jgi:hypothetical protein
MPYKDPDDSLDYAIDMAQQMTLDGDTIASVVWSVPTGLTEGASTVTTTKVSVVLSGGTAGSSYDITGTITTAGGRVYERSFTVEVVDR